MHRHRILDICDVFLSKYMQTLHRKGLTSRWIPRVIDSNRQITHVYRVTAPGES